MLKQPLHNHFLDIDGIDTATLRHILNQAVELKKDLKAGKKSKPLEGKSIALIFEKPSTRTRVSFEVGVHQLGGHPVTLQRNDLQLGRGETIADTAKVLSRYVDAIMIRCFKHETLLELAEHSTIPVINGLTDNSHPCQIMADIMAFEEHRGPIEGKVVAWLGDCNNVAMSWLHAAAKFGFAMQLACPQSFSPKDQIVKWMEKNGGKMEQFEEPEDAVKNADCVVTDAWISMGQEEEDKIRRAILSGYQVNTKIMKQANDNAVFMHCLPAHRGEEVTAEVIDGKQSIVWDEAENRLHVQKAIMLWCLGLLPHA